MKQTWFVFFLLGSLCLGGDILGADWPQFLGPQRNGISTETGLLHSWGDKGPPLLWKQKVGEGFSGPVVAKGRLILLHRLGDEEVVESLDAVTGKGQWKFSYPTAYNDQIDKGDGPRSTPVASGNRVYTLGAEGKLHCLELDSGKKVWERSLNEEYKVKQNFFGVGTTPLVEGNLVLVNVGVKGAGIVAFDKDTGKEKWKATEDGPSYSSPVAATIDKVRLAIFFTRQGIVLLEPETGKVRYQKRWRATYDTTVNAATPTVVGNLLFFSASYGTGAILLRVTNKGVEEVWQSEEAISSHYNTSVHHDGYLYGIDGRQEGGARLRCIELKTGKVQWTQKPFGCASLILADGQLIALTEKGDLVLLAPSPKGYQEKARAHVLTFPCRAEMALADGRLYARDGAMLMCWNLKK
jgi:outer membrane protein assembly factor BamB